MKNEELMSELNLMLGRINAVHTGLIVMAGSLPKTCAQEAAHKMREAAERVHSDALSLPISDTQIQEMNRVLVELAMVLEATARSHQ